MNYRELLELAAKAAGIHIRKWDPDYETYMMGHPDNGKEGFLVECGIGSSIWNPLNDDGDAFCLALALRLDVEFDGPRGVRVKYDGPDGVPCMVDEYLSSKDAASDLRRAIVLAAAEIVKGMA